MTIVYLFDVPRVDGLYTLDEVHYLPASQELIIMSSYANTLMGVTITSMDVTNGNSINSLRLSSSSSMLNSINFYRPNATFFTTCWFSEAKFYKMNIVFPANPPSSTVNTTNTTYTTNNTTTNVTTPSNTTNITTNITTPSNATTNATAPNIINSTTNYTSNLTN